jgi:hypothetical protein
MGDSQVYMHIAHTYRYNFIAVYISLIKQGKQVENGIAANGELCADHDGRLNCTEGSNSGIASLNPITDMYAVLPLSCVFIVLCRYRPAIGLIPQPSSLNQICKQDSETQ